MSNYNVSLNGLRIFEAAARHLSFTAAATELNVSQAAVSQQIRNLEDQLGSKLFERGARALSLTLSGNELSLATRSALSTINAAMDNITGASDSNILTISTAPSFASRWLIPRLDKFQHAHPDIELHIHTSGLKVDLLVGKIDAAIRLAASDENGLITELLLPDALCLVGTPELASEIGQTKERLYDFTLAADSTHLIDSRPKDYTGIFAEKSIDILGLDRDKLNMRRFNSSDNVIESALRGNTAALTRLSLCVDDLDAGRLTLLFNHCESLQHGTSLVYPVFREHDSKMRKFRQWLLVETDAFRQKLEKYL